VRRPTLQNRSRIGESKRNQRGGNSKVHVNKAAALEPPAPIDAPEPKAAEEPTETIATGSTDNGNDQPNQNATVPLEAPKGNDEATAPNDVVVAVPPKVNEAPAPNNVAAVVRPQPPNVERIALFAAIAFIVLLLSSQRININIDIAWT